MRFLTMCYDCAFVSHHQPLRITLSLCNARTSSLLAPFLGLIKEIGTPLVKSSVFPILGNFAVCQMYTLRKLSMYLLKQSNLEILANLV
mmetsp:Transcript_17611/g.25488  ORF Transcript_17611/g.25488 Transcript_17611/m.25488 type:complete len:89 (+) Transcript_17611:196-462(+)